MFKISEWADLVTAHPLPGPEMISHLFGDSSSEHRKTCGCVLILEMSSKNALTSPDYAKGIKSINMICCFFSSQFDLIYILNT